MAKAKNKAPQSKAKVTKKVSQPTKKSNTVAKPKATSTKSAPAKKAAVPAKKAAAPKKAAVGKKAAVTKAALGKKAAVPAKKAAAPKATPKKAAVGKKAAVVKSAPTAKKAATPAKKAAAPKKAAPIAKKAAPAPKAATTKKAALAPKNAAPAKKVSNKSPEKVNQPKEEKTKKNIKPAEPKKPATAISNKKVLKSKKSKDNNTPIIPNSVIEDRIGRKNTLKPSKDGAVAIIDLDRTGKKSKQKAEDSAEKFEPKLGSSILDPIENVGPAYRYSDDDLKEFKDIILKRLETARENLNYYQALMSRKDESGTDDTDNRFNSMEDGSGVMEREQLSQLAARQMQFIDHLEKALVRIENKTYGVCRVTGKLIDKARLRAVPHATLSMEAKSNRR